MNLPSNNQIVNHEKMASEKKNVIYYATNFENDLAQTVKKNGKSPESPVTGVARVVEVTEVAEVAGVSVFDFAIY